jgi:RNA polymerase sigma-70 factor (sigma-E family)
MDPVVAGDSALPRADDSAAPGVCGAPIGREVQIEALYAAHYQPMLRMALLLMGGDSSAEDVVQEAFIRVYGSRSNIRDPDRAAAYLRVTTMNLARSALRRRLLAARHPAAPPADAATPEERAIAGVRAALVVRALRQLPQRQREVVVLRYYADLSLIETARALQISEGAVKSYGSRGLARLAVLLEELR